MHLNPGSGALEGITISLKILNYGQWKSYKTSGKNVTKS
jgi:hypothetical protein